MSTTTIPTSGGVKGGVGGRVVGGGIQKLLFLNIYNKKRFRDANITNNYLFFTNLYTNYLI